MKRAIIPVFILTAALVLAVLLPHVQSRNLAGFPAPDFTLPGLNGKDLRLSDLRGKVVFLNLFTTWCPPCRMEMPAMETLYRRLQDRGFVVVAVSQDEGGAKVVSPFVAEMKLSFPVLLDPIGRLSGRYGITGYPETFLIDRNGNVLKHFVGPEEWLSNEMTQYFASVLDGGDTEKMAGGQ